MALSFTEYPSTFSINMSLQSAVEKFKLNRTRRVAYIRTYRELASMTDADLVQLKIGRPMIGQMAQQAADRV